MKLSPFSRGLSALFALCLFVVACSGDASDPVPAASGGGSADPESVGSGAGSADPEPAASEGDSADVEPAASEGDSADVEPAASEGDSADVEPGASEGDSADPDVESEASGGGSAGVESAASGGGSVDSVPEVSEPGSAGVESEASGGGSADPEPGLTDDGDGSAAPTVDSADEEIPDAEVGADPTLPGPYAVGAASAFVRDPSRPFDPWGARYKSPVVQAVIQEVRAAGDPHIVPVEIHYPVEAAPGAAVSLAVQPARVAPAADPDAVRATNLDYFHGDRTLYEAAFGAQIVGLGLPGSPRLGVEEVEAENRRSFLNAPLAEGRFPVVVLSHGLGGSGRQWTAAAEHLASHGYVVVSPSYISDSSSSLVFHDPDSAYMAGRSGATAAAAAESRFGADQPVFRNFFDLGWGAPPPFGPGGLDPSSLTAIDGGAAAVAVMMGELFQQRVDDIAAVLGYLDALSAPAADCESRLGPDGVGGGGDRAPRCGAFEGAVDTGRVGVMGHSLGSITSQVASVQLEAVRAVVGLNNGLPSTWEPGGGFPDASGDPDLPDGVTKPIAFLSGAEDDFLDFVFRNVWMETWTASGGDLDEMFPLPAEQAVPTADNPLPIVASSYARATGPKINMMVTDLNHDLFTDNVGVNISYRLTAKSTMRSVRFPKGAERDDPSFRGESYELLGWAADDDGNQQYLPHQIRNHYAVAMFNTYVKQDPAFAPWLETDRFDAYATTARQNLD